MPLGATGALGCPGGQGRLPGGSDCGVETLHAGGGQPGFRPDRAAAWAQGAETGFRGDAGAWGEGRRWGEASAEAPGLGCAPHFGPLLLPFQIEALPPELFQCRKLRALHLGNNVLQSLPSRVGELTNLTQIELRGNRLECLPVELGECPLLKRSGLVVEEDLFNTLPPEVKERLWRADKEQA